MKIALAVALALTSSNAFARTLRYAKDGSGDFKTLKELLEKAQPGDDFVSADRASLGLAIKRAGLALAVTAVMPSMGAEGAGLKAGDLIEGVEGQDPAKLTMEEIMALLQGPEGTTATVQVAGRAVSVVRKPIPIKIDGDDTRASAAWWERQNDLAISYDEKGAKAGSILSLKRLAKVYDQKGLHPDPKKRFPVIKALADAGDSWGEASLGYAYLHGLGCRTDLAQFVHWTEIAASNGSRMGEHNMGYALSHGVGVERDKRAALDWYRKAAAQGDKEAAKSVASLEGKKASAAPVASASSESAEEGGEPAPHAAVAALKASGVDKPSYSKAERADDVAVVIGIENYATLPTASYAERDAQALRAHLIALGFPERNVFTLIGPSATKSAFIKELETRLSRVTKPDSTVFVYYSGHGAPDPKTGNAYLVPYDGDPEFLDDTAYPVSRLYQKLGTLPAKRVIVALDSCFSGAGGRSVLAHGVRPLVTQSETAPKSANIVALTAASQGEISGALDDQRHGLFTYYLLDGLNMGKTNIGQLEAYLGPKVADEARRHNRDQTPRLIGDGADLELGK